MENCDGFGWLRKWKFPIDTLLETKPYYLWQSMF